MSGLMMRFDAVAPNDFGDIWPLIEPVVREGRTYPYGRDWPAARVAEAWFANNGVSFAAREAPGRTPLGAFYLKPNALGPGAHVANAGFVSAAHARGRGVGRAMGVFALEEAKRRGYAAMQFNMVAATNTASLNLWLSLGFEIVGTVPAAFDDAVAGRVDIHIMHRFL